MDRSMIIASNTMSGLQKQMDTIGNNIANLDTTGYKRRTASFNSLLYQEFQKQNPSNERAIHQGVGANIGQISINMSQGSIKSTDRMLDVAFTKEGQFLTVLVEDNGNFVPRLTRDGALYLSPLQQGQSILVTSEGYPVLDENNQQIIIEDGYKDIHIGEHGTMTVTANNGEKTSYNLQVVQVMRPQMLVATGENQFEMPDSQDIAISLVGNARTEIRMKQYALEHSNVDLSTEMSNLLIAQRSYQFNAKSISIADQMLGLINGLR